MRESIRLEDLSYSGAPVGLDPGVRWDLVNRVWNLFDAAVRHYNLRITCCRCAHAEAYHAAALWKMFESRD